ncbi:hypothetical protein PIROE2DRAFT_47176, partial [Piromyces sp. E2]
KVPFEMVPELVRTREILIKKGNAFIPDKNLDVVLGTIFKDILTTNLELVSKLKGLIEVDFGHILPILDSLEDQCHCNVEYWRDSDIMKENIQHTQVSSLAKYFPPCMNFLFTKLKQHQHLKFAGRMQFGLFLKCGVGLTLHESLLFWQKAFYPRFNTLDFQRNYAYNIRHNYGKEGSRIDYVSFDCEKIQMSNEPTSYDHYHGCPFKHFSEANLISYLRQYLDQYSNPTSISQSSQDNDYVQRNRFILTITNLVKQKSIVKPVPIYIILFNRIIVLTILIRIIQIIQKIW